MLGRGGEADLAKLVPAEGERLVRHRLRAKGRGRRGSQESGPGVRRGRKRRARERDRRGGLYTGILVRRRRPAEAPEEDGVGNQEKELRGGELPEPELRARSLMRA